MPTVSLSDAPINTPTVTSGEVGGGVSLMWVLLFLVGVFVAGLIVFGILRRTKKSP
jgi:hypothetical protein